MKHISEHTGLISSYQLLIMKGDSMATISLQGILGMLFQIWDI